MVPADYREYRFLRRRRSVPALVLSALRIEDWHRVLKSGCAVERIAHDTAERIRRAIAINVVIAWRIMLMTLLGRQTPELPPEVLFSDIELQVLCAYSKKTA